MSESLWIEPAIELFHWNPRVPVLRGRIGRRIPVKRRPNNFGDLLGPLIANELLSRKGISNGASPYSARLFTVGSVLHFARTGDTVWGSGRNGKIADAKHQFEKLDVRAVRGPLTRKYLESRGLSVPAVYGDPALLLPELFPVLNSWRSEKVRDVVIVPNLNDSRSMKMPHLNPRSELWTCLETIARSEFVVASSLHAVIVAEALGIPARLVRPSLESSFKYDDYFLGTGRVAVEPADTFEQALVDGPTYAAAPLEWESAELLASFPFDLWQRTPG